MNDGTQDEKPVKAKLYTVSEPIDRTIEKLIGNQAGLDVQFNPTSLKVSLSNSLKEDEKSGNSRAAQYIDKSSSSLTVELIFDTSDSLDQAPGGAPPKRADVRLKTGRIANTFMKPVKAKKSKNMAPQRCLFQWGSFAFVGIMESFDETLEFFSPEGTPLRATVALKLSESRFQFRSEESKKAEQETPTLSSPAQDASVDEANSEAGKDEKDWRDTSMYNGVESPRLPSAPALAVPNLSAGASLNASASISGGAPASLGASASFGASAGIGGGISASATAKLTPPSFKYGASAALGTGISGAFSTSSKGSAGLTAGALVSGGARLRAGTAGSSSFSASASGSATAGAAASGSAGVGFD